MLPIARLTSVGYDLARHFFPQRFLDKPRRKASRKKVGRLRHWAHLELDRLEDRTLLSAAIAGNVFNDLNGSGVRVGGDPGVAGQTVFLDLNHDGKFDSTKTTIAAGSTSIGATPGLLGEFGFFSSTMNVEGVSASIDDVAVSMDVANNSPDPIPVFLVSPVGLQVPNLPTLFTLQPGQHFDGTFDDNATNAVNQAANPVPDGTYAPQQVLSNPQMYITNEDPNGTWGLTFVPPNPSDIASLQVNSWSLTFTNPEPSTQTDAAGNYSFTGLNSGNYQVGVALTPNEMVTAPTAGSDVQSVSVADGQTATGKDFGVQPAADLTATAFHLNAPATAWGQSITINYTLANQGLGDAPAFDVGLYLSNNGTIGASGPLLNTLHIAGLAAGASISGSVTVQLPATPPPGFDSLADVYVGSIIDPTNSISESSANQSNQGAGLDLAQLGTASNVAVTADSSVQQSPSIAVDPTNPQHLVTAYMDYSLLDTGYAGIGISISNDGGATWTKDPTPIQLPAGFTQGAAAPTVAFDANGHVYISFMAATFLGAQPDQTDPDNTQRLDGFESNNGIFVAESTDGGTTWGAPQVVPSSENVYTGTSVSFAAYPSMAIDTFKTLPDSQANPNYGNIYVTWTEFYAPGQFPGDSSSRGGSFVMLAVSNTSNGGSEWTTQYQTVPGSGPGTGVVSVLEDPYYGGNDAVAPGTGYVAFSTVTVGAGGAVYVSSYVGGWFTVYASTNGGQSFTTPSVFTYLGSPFNYTDLFVGPNATLDNFRTLATREIVADPTRSGVLYAVTANSLAASQSGSDAASGILFAVSDDYGQSWTTNFTVGSEGDVAAQLTRGELNNWFPVLNDENGGEYPPYGSPAQDQVIASQAMPQIAVNAQGDVAVIWYDTRSDPSGTNLEVWGTVSTDGGQHFSANFPISTAAFDPNSGAYTDGAGNTSYDIGDQIGLAVTDDAAYAVWTGTGSGTQYINSDSFALNPIPAAPADRFSPNFTYQTATALGIVTVQQIVPQLALSAGSANEWFSLQAGASGELSISATAASSGNNLQLELTDANGNPLSAVSTSVLDSSGNVIGQEIVVDSVAGQTYLVRVSGQSADGISYSLTAQSLTADLGAAVEGTEAGSLAAGGTAVYRLEIDPTGSLTVTLDANSDVQGNLNLQVLTADGQTVLASIPTGGVSAGKSAKLSLSVTAGQVVLLEVSGVSGTDNGDFTIQFANLDQFQTAGARTLYFATGSTPASLAVADLTGNGTDDLLATNTTTSDTLSVLLGNGDGTFQAPEQTAIGPGQSFSNSIEPRQIAVANLTSNGIPDVIVPNLRSADVSVLLGNGNGTFQPQRRFDAVTDPGALVTGDFTGNGNTDVAVLENFGQSGSGSDLAILIGRGDGTFLPPQPPVPNDPNVKVTLYQTAFTNGATAMVVGDWTGNGILDIIVFSDNSPFAQIFYGNGDGTFRNGGTFSVGEDTYSAVAVDLNGDGKLDLVTTGTNSGNVYVLLGNGDGTFQAPVAYQAMKPAPGEDVGVHGLAVVDFGSATAPGTPDGHLDIIVTAQGSSTEVIMLPGLVDSHGQFAGFGAPVVLAHVGVASNIATGDFTGNNAIDLAVADTGGITVIYGTPPALVANSTPATARDLGTVTHLMTLSQSIVSSQEDAYYTLTVPTETVPGSGAEVLDFAAQFQNTGGGGIQMQVLDAHGNVLGTGDRFRVTAAQGAVLTVHVFGVAGTDGTPSSGSYILDVDVLPQVVSVQAESALPGGPATSLVVTLQGDHLDPATAENPANYTVLWFGPNGPEVIPVAAVNGGQPIVYDPGAYVQIASGLTYPSASRQTITLLFANPLPAGSYEITLSPAIQSAALNSGESALLAGNTAFAGHPLVTNDNGTITNGDSVFATDLVSKAGTPNPDAIDSGTAFLTQLGNDLGALLDSLLAQEGDDPSITTALNDQILARFVPGFTPGTGPQSYAIFWLDPVAIGLQTPQQGQQVSYNLQSNSVSNTASQTYIAVGGNVEVIVVAGISGTFNLSVANVPETARGGAVVITPNGSQALAFTDDLRAGMTSFDVTVAAANVTGTGTTGTGTTGTGTTGTGTTGTGTTGTGTTGTGTTGTGQTVQGTTTTSNTVTNALTTATTAETETTTVASVSSPANNSADSLAQLVSQGLISSLVAGSAGETQATSATSFVNTGPAANGATSGVAAPSSSAAAGGNSGDALGNFLLEVENAIDQVFLLWRDSSEAVSSASRPYAAGAVDVVEKAVSPVGNLLEAVGGKALMRTGLPWRDMLKILSQYSGSVTEEFSKELPIPRVKGIHSAPPVVGPPAPEEEEEESLWEQDFTEAPLGEQMMWEGKEVGLALLVVSGAYHAWLRDQNEDEITSRKKPEMFPKE